MNVHQINAAETTVLKSLTRIKPGNQSGMARLAKNQSVVECMHALVRKDPIFAAIEAHAAAEMRYSVECANLDRIETEFGRGKRQDETGRLAAARAANEAAERASSRVTRKLCNTKPTTAAGLAALLSYLKRDLAGGWKFYDGRSDALFDTLIASAKSLASEAA